MAWEAGFAGSRWQLNGYGLAVAKFGNGLQKVIGLNFDCIWT